MSNQVEPGTVGSAAAVPGPGGLAEQAARAPQVPQAAGTHVSYPAPFHGRVVSWVAVSIIMVAFLIGGLALVFGPIWWLFYASVGLAVVGGLIALATNIFEDWY